MLPPRSLVLVALALAVGVIVVQARVVAGGKTWDDVRYHAEIAPPRLAAAVEVQRGALPAWWDGTGFGVPLLAEPSHGASYPPIWIAATPHALDLVLVLHLVWAALGVAVWARRRTPPATTTVSDPSALVVGLLVATTGILASAAVRGALPALAHVPWVGAASAWLGGATERRDRARAAAALGLLVAAIALVGELAVLVDAVVLVLAIAVRRRTVAWVAAALGAGLAIGAAQWVPAVLELGRGAGATVHGIPLARILELIVPGSFGSTNPERAISALAGDTAWAPSLFVGAPILALAAIRAPSRRVVGALAVFAGFALVVGRGGWPAWVGAPELHVAALAIVLAAHAGGGLDALVAAERRAMLALGVAAACSAIALGALGALRAKHPEAAPAIDRALFDGGLGVVCIAGVIVLAWRAPGRWIPLVLALLVLPGVGAMPSVAPTIDRSYVDDPPAWAHVVDEVARPIRVYRPSFMQDHVETLDDVIATFGGASAARWEIASARSEDVARPSAHDEVWLAAASEGGALLDRFGISLAILPATMMSSHEFVELGRRGRWALAALPVAPSASVLRGWRWAVEPADAIALMFAAGGGTNVLRGTVVLGGSGVSQDDRGPPVPCTIPSWRPGDIDLVCTPSTDGYAAVTSTPARGWSVEVDGREAGWVTADVLRRAVAVGAGMHHVHWSYRTPGGRVGLWGAAAGVLALAALWFAGRWSLAGRVS